MSLFLLYTLAVIVVGYSKVGSLDNDGTLRELFKKIQSYQVTHSQNLSLPFRWKKDRGVYPSFVKLNLVGSREMAFMRDNFGVFDNNMFVTVWTAILLLESFKYGGQQKPDEKQILTSLENLATHKDRNMHYDNSNMNFWPQIENKTVSYWQNTPVNLIGLIDTTDSLPVGLIEKVLEKLGLDDIANFLKLILKTKEHFKSAFQIPADFDDSFVNIGLGSLLEDLRDDFSESAELWKKNNRNISSVMAALSKYAYRPMSGDTRVNSIDPRTYFYLRTFLGEAAVGGGTIALVPTWMQDVHEVLTELKKGVHMPFNINNVDVTVSANTLYGITAGLLHGVLEPELFDEDIQQIYQNTTMMIAYQVQNNFTARPDLALTYYPSRFECYWFIARFYALLRRWPQPLPYEVMQIPLREFGDIFRGRVTDEFKSSAKTDAEGRVYFDDFLGNGDHDDRNHTIIKGHDRIFTTSMVVNTLISTWTGFDATTRKLYWETDTPTAVKNLVSSAVQWLDHFVLSGKFKPWNAFFSGSGKGVDSMPFWYPANRLEYFNGTHFNDTHLPHEVDKIIALQGIIPNSEYDEMIKGTHFGKKTPVDFHGLNTESFFPFWCSNTYTYATTLLALSQYGNIACC